MAYTAGAKIKRGGFRLELKKLIRQGGYTISAICRELGITRAGFEYKLKHGTLRAGEIIKIASLLGVDGELILNAVKGENNDRKTI